MSKTIQVLKKFRKFDKKLYIIAASLVAIILLVSGGLAYFIQRNSQSGQPSREAAVASSPRLETPEKISKIADVPPSSVPEKQAQPAPQESQSVTVPQPKAPKVTPAPQAVPPAQTLVKEIKIFNPPYPYCSSSSGGMFRFPGAYLFMNAVAGGTVSWQIEKRLDGVVSTGISGSFVATAADVMHEISGYDAQITGELALRLHVTSPNDIATQWYTPTAGPGCYQ